MTSPQRKDESRPQADSLRYHRYLCTVTPSVYFIWWFVVEYLLKSVFNPIGSRLFICSLFLAVLGLSYLSKFVEDHMEGFYGLCAGSLTAHYYYLFYHNPSDLNWVIGNYVTVLAVGMTIDRLRGMIPYSLLVVIGSYYVAAHDNSSMMGLPGIVTVLALINIVGFLREKVERERRLRTKAEAEKAAAEIVSKAKSMLLANMSHELRTPLTSIIGFSDLMATKAKLNDESRVWLERVRSNGRSLLDMVNQILLLTNDDIEPLQIGTPPLDIRELITNRVNIAQAAAFKKGLNLSLVCTGEFSPAIISDSQYIIRIFDNVVNNAIKFTEKGGIEVQVQEVTTDALDSVTYSICIKDSGIGIEKSYWDSVFQSFSQVQQEYTRAFGGAGVGLSVARKLARAMGGEVKIEESAPGVGTLIRIILKVNRY